METFDIKITRQEAREQLGLPGNKKIILYTGHLYTWKGVDTLADASKNLPVDILIYTVGGDAQEIDAFYQRNPNHKTINIPAVTREKVAIWLKAADLLILPNSAKEKISAKYTSPLKLFEYLASGTPIIASDLPSVNEILDQNDCAFFTADDASSLASTILKSLSDELLLNDLTSKMKKIALQYSWQQRSALILSKIIKQ